MMSSGTNGNVFKFSFLGKPFCGKRIDEMFLSRVIWNTISCHESITTISTGQQPRDLKHCSRYIFHSISWSEMWALRHFKKSINLTPTDRTFPSLKPCLICWTVYKEGPRPVRFNDYSVLQNRFQFRELKFVWLWYNNSNYSGVQFLLLVFSSVQY